MSRSYCDDSWNEPGDQWRAVMWQANLRRAFKGKRGQANLRILLAEFQRMEAALNYAFPEWMPPTDGPRLIADDICRNGEVCAVGAFMRAKSPDGFPIYARQWADQHPIVKYGEDDTETIYGWVEAERTANFAVFTGLQKVLGWELSITNDEVDSYGFRKETPEQRFRRMKRWVEQKLAVPS